MVGEELRERPGWYVHEIAVEKHKLTLVRADPRSPFEALQRALVVIFDRKRARRVDEQVDDHLATARQVTVRSRRSFARHFGRGRR